MHLPVGITLQGGKYEIISYISSGGFGCTYKARHAMLNTTVAIKEFFVKDYCNRDAQTYNITVATQGKQELIERLRKKFIEEAQAIFNMNHPNIVRVTDIFQENGTVYYVMDYIDGSSLAAKIAEKGKLAESETLGYIRQVADALSYVHSQNRLHLDVKPQNIMIDQSGKAVLIDFGVSKQYDEVNGENTSTLLGSTPGYAPIEQSGNGVVRFYPSADIYALGATLYKALTGVTPVAAHLRASGEELESLPAVITEPTRVALDAAMQINKAHRPQSVEEFLELLKGSKDLRDPKAFKDLKGLNEETVMPSRSLNAKAIEVDNEETRAVEKKTEQPTVKNNEPAEPKKNRTVWVVAVLGVLIVCGLFFALSGGDNGSSNGGNDRLEARMQAYQDSIDAVNAAREAAEQQAAEEAASRERESSSSSARTFTVDGVSFKMVAVKGGTFQMGATSEQQNAYDNERPVHSVTLSDYYIGETEVTQELWQAVMGSNPSIFTGNSQRPVESVTWNDCQEFISRLNSKTGMSFRLPTEAEWEYAARGGNRSNKTQYSGSSNISNVAWYRSNSGGTTHPVKQKQPNELGLYDMSGNVWEWCNDWHSYDYYSNSPRNNPQGPSSGSRRVLRGGDLDGNARGCRVASRDDGTPDGGGPGIGLRLVLVAGGSGEGNNDNISSTSSYTSNYVSYGNMDFTVNGVSFKMVAVEGGTFQMGSNDGYDIEKPVHSVTLSDYYIGETEVTQELWQAVMGSNPSSFTGNSQRPVECVSWNDCQEFISRLNDRTGMNFHLPTEAEWEYAARGGNRSNQTQYSGSSNIDNVAWYYSNSGGTTHPVKQKQPNELGIYDMSGNVYEWCNDWYSNDYYSNSPRNNPQGSSEGSRRVLRGGGWYFNARFCCVARRSDSGPGGGYYFNGLRLAL